MGEFTNEQLRQRAFDASPGFCIITGRSKKASNRARPVCIRAFSKS